MRKYLFPGALILLFFLQACGGASATDIPAATPETTPIPTDASLETAVASIPYSKNIRFEKVTLEDGFSQSVVNVILQYRKGFLWFGTDDGLNRYDGYTFTVYRPDVNAPSSLKDRTITALAEDTNGILWVGTRQGGLSSFDPATGIFTNYVHIEGDDTTIASDQINSLSPDESGLWIGTDNGLDYLDFATNTFTHFRAGENDSETNKLSSNNIRTLFRDSKGQLWIGTGNAGVNIYDPVNKTFNNFKYNKQNKSSLSHNRVLSIAEDKNGNMWIGTANGLNQYIPDRDVFRRFENSGSKPDSLAGNIVNSIMVDQAGGVWIGTNRGLDRFDPINLPFVHHQNQPGVPKSLSNNQVLSVYEDASGVIWVGTFGGGLNKYNRQQDRFAYFNHNPNEENGLNSNFIMALLAEKNGYLWIGTLDSGLNRFDPTTENFVHYENNPTDPSSLSSNFVHSLYIDSENVLWVGTGRALDRFDRRTRTFKHYAPPRVNILESSNFSVSAIYEDSKNRLWIGSNQGLMLFDRETESFSEFSLHDPANPQGVYSVTAILEDVNNTLWIGTYEGGLKSIDLENENVTHYWNDPGNSSSLGNNFVLTLYQDTRGILWVGTHGGGLGRFDPATETFKNFTELEGLPSNVVYGILEDDQGNLWISTNYGLSRFNPMQETFRNFTASDGLQANEFNQNAYTMDGRGRMYFGGINGMNIFKPEAINDNPYLPKISLTTLTLGGSPLGEGQMPEYLQEITLQWPNDSFEFEFAAFTYEQPAKNQYSYMLEGFDPDWIELGTRRNGRYTNLPGGTYTLRLRGSNSDGMWNETSDTIKVVVVPPFWETWWFSGMLVLLFGVTVAGGLRWRVKNIESRNLELERLVSLRTADLEKRNSEIEALYMADERIIRSVTNNHIFQTLVDVSISILKADRSAVFTWNEEKQMMIPRLSQGFQPETLSALNFARGEGHIGIAIKTGSPVIISNIRHVEIREDIRAAIEAEGIESFAHFPILMDQRVVAIFNVAYTRPNALNKDSIRLFTALVNRASMSIANMELFEQTRDLAVMEERNRLARDLHDSAKQKAFAALAQLGTATGMAKASPQGAYAPDVASPHLIEAETLIYEVIQELNFLIQEIYPIALQEKGLPSILREYIFEWENRNDALINLTIQNERELPLEMEQAVYRVIQEGLANVSRHSQATQVDISLVYNPDLLQVSMADNGRGFDMNQKAKGLGFRSMRERISSIRGTFQIQSAPGQGTRILIQIPLKAVVGD